MKQKLSFIVLMFSASLCYGQPNCNIYKWKSDTACYNACMEATRALDFDQGSKESQLRFDTAIQMCPSLDYAWYEKSVPYLKRGDFITWMKLMDTAVRLNPIAYLGSRGWCRYKFLRDYEGARRDIELLDSLSHYDIGYSSDGDYHLDIVKALCYKGLGENKRAIELFERQLSLQNYTASLYDYLHLGVLYLESGNYKAAISALQNSIKTNDCLAETHYYLALAYKRSGNNDEYENQIQIAKDFYLNGKKRTDPYVDPMDKIYLADIDNEMKKG